MVKRRQRKTEDVNGKEEVKNGRRREGDRKNLREAKKTRREVKTIN